MSGCRERLLHGAALLAAPTAVYMLAPGHSLPHSTLWQHQAALCLHPLLLCAHFSPADAEVIGYARLWLAAAGDPHLRAWQ
jgi:hypothetical protein